MMVGDRIRLVHTDDTSGIPPGEEGTVIFISEVSKADVSCLPGTGHLVGRRRIWVEWDEGGKLALIEGYDEFEVIT